LSVAGLVDEYRTMLAELAGRDWDVQEVEWDRIAARISAEGDWTGEGAGQLLALARDYGSFFLRNALALAVALRIEDGELGF
jgi:hypothetical protein